MVAIPDDDVADAHGDADPAGALDLRTAHFDGIAVADIFLDRGGEPGRRHLEIDRTCAKPPPQPAEAAGEDHHQKRDHDGEALYPAFGREPSPQRLEAIAESVKTGARPGQQPARAKARRLILVLIPIGIIPLREPDVVGARTRPLGRRIPCHCLSVLALIARLIAAKARVDT
jgi:hypothetical protein